MVSEKAEDGKLGTSQQRPYALFLVSVFIRALHQVGAAVYLSSFLLDGISGPPAFYLGLSVVTGLLLMVTEKMRHIQFYREFAGVGTFVKLVLLGIAYHGLLPQTPTVVAAFIVAAVAAHLPKNIRHRLLY